MSVIVIGPYRYKVLKQDGNRVLLGWVESATGIEKTRWVLLTNMMKKGA